MSSLNAHIRSSTTNVSKGHTSPAPSAAPAYVLFCLYLPEQVASVTGPPTWPVLVAPQVTKLHDPCAGLQLAAALLCHGLLQVLARLMEQMHLRWLQVQVPHDGYRVWDVFAGTGAGGAVDTKAAGLQ